MPRERNVAISSQRKTPAGHSRKVRVYIANAPRPEMPLPPYSSKGVNEEIDKAWRQYNRTEIRIMRRYAGKAVAKHYGYKVKMRFARSAGCRCGCSPGFILDREGSYDLYVTVSNE